ncbi:hypothetical protein DYB36_010717 [Aphanomyces astaci]|uniref:Chromo domain-containing protein n=1 Tax=Aphanomyces astaci TaxID=112090 RepID=A0A397BF38_APHAT|nr:hypothetical protein DYB36_010717 [Aphanomyces astaci]
MSKLFSEFVAALVRLLMEGFAEAEPNLRAEPNLMVDYLVAAVQPLAVRARVKELMKLNENRSLKKDVEPMMADKLLTATKAPKVVAVVNVDKVPKSNFTQERSVRDRRRPPNAHESQVLGVDGRLPANVGDILLSRAIIYKLGFDPRAMLREAASVTGAIDMADAVSHSGVVLAVSHELVDNLAEEEDELLPLDMNSYFPDMVAVDAEVKVVLDAKIMSATLADVGEGQRENIAATQLVLEEVRMHIHMSVENARKHDHSRQYHDEKQGMKMAQFVVENYALYQKVWGHLRQHLRTKECTYRFEVEAMVDARYVATNKDHELFIKWCGLQDVDNSWEPADYILADVPVMFKAFCKGAKSAVL